MTRDGPARYGPSRKGDHITAIVAYRGVTLDAGLFAAWQHVAVSSMGWASNASGRHLCLLVAADRCACDGGAPGACVYHARDHISRHLTDGALDFTLIKYDEGTQSQESQASGAGPCIHHFVIEVEHLHQAEREIKAYGCEIISDPGVIPIKFRAPGGTVAELVPVGRYKQLHSQ